MRNELTVAQAHRADWQLVRLWNFAREARAFELRPPLEAHVSLLATSFQASLLLGRLPQNATRAATATMSIWLS